MKDETERRGERPHCFSITVGKRTLFVWCAERGGSAVRASVTRVASADGSADDDDERALWRAALGKALDQPPVVGRRAADDAG